MPIVTYQCIGRSVHGSGPDQTILDLSIANKIPHWRDCGGRGRCTTCRIRVRDGLSNLTPRSPVEAALASARGWNDTTRLACQTCVLGDVTIERTVTSRGDASQLQLDSIGGQIGIDRDLAILFCDMRNFVGIADSNSAYDVMHILNRFFAAVGEPILINGGVITQYVGDQICGLFGLNDGTPKMSCESSVRSALGMVAALEELNKDLREEFNLHISIGIGVHFGTAILGRVGHPAFKHVAVNGGDVNTASRIESLNKDLNTTILVSDTVVENLPPNMLTITRSENVQLKGHAKKTRVHAISGFTEPSRVLIVQQSVGRVFREESNFATRFYRNLFKIAPDVEKLFVNGTEMQGPMLKHMLNSIIFSLEQSRHVAGGLHTMGRQHRKYGVKLRHYRCFKDAFMQTLGEVLGPDDFGEDTASAWEETIDIILQLMKSGAEGSHINLS